MAQREHNDNVAYLKGARDGIKTANVLWVMALWNVYDSCKNRIYKPQLAELLQLGIPEHRRLRDYLGEEDCAELVMGHIEPIAEELGIKLEDLG
jgi:hypothetical protein